MIRRTFPSRINSFARSTSRSPVTRCSSERVFGSLTTGLPSLGIGSSRRRDGLCCFTRMSGERLGALLDAQHHLPLHDEVPRLEQQELKRRQPERRRFTVTP